MKKNNLIFVLLIFVFCNIYSQKFSKNKIKKWVSELNEIVTDTIYYDYQKTKDIKLDTPKLEYYVNNNMTSNVLSKDPNFSDNEVYSLFQKIYNKGKCKDFEIMCLHKNPAIRVYGFWALLKNNEYNKAKIYLIKEKSKSEDINWNSVGCLIDKQKTYDFMKKKWEVHLKNSGIEKHNGKCKS